MAVVFRFSKISWCRINIDRSVFAWMVLLSIGIHVVTGDRDAIVQVLSSGDGVLGHYSSLGSGDTVVTGILHEVTGNCTKKFVHPVVPDEEPIGILFLPEVDESKNHKEPSQSTTCTILDQVKQVMLLGCSALVVLALNPSLLKDLDGSQIFSKPIVKVTTKENVEFVKKEMKSPHSKKAIIKPVRRAMDEKPAVVSIPRLTLWSTCGKSSGGTHREWEGTVCLGGNQFTSPVSFSTLWQYIFSLIVSLYIILTLKKTRQPQRLEDVEDSLQRLAKLSVSKMPTRKYKKKGQVASQESDNCAICLDEFTKGQVIRTLPCRHNFHCKCVDDWLIKRRTCPLCKMDIVDQKFHCYSNL